MRELGSSPRVPSTSFRYLSCTLKGTTLFNRSQLGGVVTPNDGLCHLKGQEYNASTTMVSLYSPLHDYFRFLSDTDLSGPVHTNAFSKRSHQNLRVHTVVLVAFFRSTLKLSITLDNAATVICACERQIDMPSM